MRRFSTVAEWASLTSQAVHLSAPGRASAGDAIPRLQGSPESAQFPMRRPRPLTRKKGAAPVSRSLLEDVDDSFGSAYLPESPQLLPTPVTKSHPVPQL